MVRLNKVGRNEHWKGDFFILDHMLETPDIYKYESDYTQLDKHLYNVKFQDIDKLHVSMKPELR